MKVGRPKIKRCTKCLEYKPVEEFSTDKRAKSGLQSSCKECQKIYRQNNKEQILEYLEKTKEQRGEKMREYYLKNKDAINNWRRNYYAKEGKLKVLAGNLKRKAEKISTSDGSVTESFLKDLFIIQNGKCNICGKDISDKFHVDHIIPLSRKGQHKSDNIQLLCQGCNLKKSNKVVEDLLEERETKYDPEVVITYLLNEMKKGKSIEQICVGLDVNKTTFYSWLKKYEELANAKKRGEELSYDWWLEKGRNNLENKLFNPTLFYMNMKNRFNWRDRTEVTGKDGKDLIPRELKLEISDRLKDLI